MALSKGRQTAPCNHKNCQCCQIVSSEKKIDVNGIVGRPTTGSFTIYTT